jgi:carboxymethylenebutenolidase
MTVDENTYVSRIGFHRSFRIYITPHHARRKAAAACPIVASYGAKDRWNQGVADQLERALETCFHRPRREGIPGCRTLVHEQSPEHLLQGPAFRRIAYNEPATLDARRRIAAFFRTHLQP